MMACRRTKAAEEPLPAVKNIQPATVSSEVMREAHAWLGLWLVACGL
jgi:hypothetical protein